MLKALFYVGIGGGAGSMLRYGVSVWSQRLLPGIFPTGTLIVNLVGCLLIGLIVGVLQKDSSVSPDLRLLFVTGFCGGFTTFSAFSFENLQLMQSGNTSTALFYIFLSIVLGLAAVWLGMYLVR